MAFVITSLRGGVNDSDPPIALADDQVTRAVNVEYVVSTLGERRRGAVQIDISGSVALTACDRIVWSHRHLPTTDEADAQLWVMGIDGASAVLAYKDTSWHTVTMADALTIDGVSEYQIEGVSLHAKLFLFYNSGVDRLHVYDPRTSTTALRRVGLEPLTTGPTVVDDGSGSLSGTRYYRVRETVQVSGTTILRSEPSEVTTFTPSGTGAFAFVYPANVLNSNATHFEYEASSDGANFYVIVAGPAVNGTVFGDALLTISYPTFPLSEDSGDYVPPHSATHGIADEDRLLVFGSHEDDELSSSASWTPVFNAAGVGNDERIPLDPVSVVNLDGFSGGAITDVSSAVAGEIWPFKRSHVYKLTRTGRLARAYEAFRVSTQHGALPGSVVEGVDESGTAAIYFLDRAVGPMRAGRGGVRRCGRDIWTTWRTVHVDATVVSRGLYYPTTQQVLYCVATNDADVPDFGLTLQTNEQRVTEGGDVRRGWSTRTGPSCGALTMCLFSEDIDDDNDRSHVLVPFIGIEGDGLMWRLDTGDDDNGTEYGARITTKPYSPSELQTKFEVKTATLVGKAVEGAHLIVSVIPDFDDSQAKVSQPQDFSPAGSEAHVARFMDDLGISDATVAQFDFSDTDTPGRRWELARLSATMVPGQGS